MTAVQTSLAHRIQDASTDIARLLGEISVNFTLALEDCENRVTRFDYGRALWTFLADLGGDIITPEDRERFLAKERPTTTPADERPLYLRLDDESEWVSDMIRRNLMGLNMAQAVLAGVNQQLSDELYDAFQRFSQGLGIPTSEEYAANPELFTDVTDDINEALSDSPLAGMFETVTDKGQAA